MKSLELSLRFEELETLSYKKPKSMNKERPQRRILDATDNVSKPLSPHSPLPTCREATSSINNYIQQH